MKRVHAAAATAALDPAAEGAIRETLSELAGQCTLVIVTHRPALVSLGDQVIFLEQGAVVEPLESAGAAAR